MNKRTHLHCCLALLQILLAFGLACPGSAQPARETLTLAREHRGQPIKVTGELLLPAGTGKVPAVVIHHGSGGVSEAREFRYAREMVAMGVAAFVIDSFAPRGITSTVSDQATVNAREMADDAFAALQALAAHARIDAAKVGIFGFSKGGTVSWMTAHERRAARVLPAGLRFALHVPFYPGCGENYFRPRTTGAPILMLIGAADTYVGVTPCTEYAEKLKAAGASIEVKIYPGAQHGWDTDRAYSVPKGENYSRCIFEEQADGSWKERTSGQVTNDTQGRPVEPGRQNALNACRTYGVSGGPSASAREASMTDLKAAVSRHLLDAK